MAVQPTRTTLVASTAAKLTENAAKGRTVDSSDDFAAVTVQLKNATAATTVFVAGDNTVSAANGYPWDQADGPLRLDLEPGEQVWVFSTGTPTLHVLRVGR